MFLAHHVDSNTCYQDDYQCGGQDIINYVIAAAGCGIITYSKEGSVVGIEDHISVLIGSINSLDFSSIIDVPDTDLRGILPSLRS